MARFRLISQHDGMQCGVACVAMICRHFNRNFSILDLENYCAASKQGISLKAIHDAAATIGLDTAAGKLTIESLAKNPLPCVLHWKQNHFVVLYKVNRQATKFWIADPAKGKYQCSVEDMRQFWVSTRSNAEDKGIAMFFEPTPEFENRIEANQPPIHSFRFLWKYFIQYRRLLLQIVLGLTLGCLLQLILPFLTQWIVDIGIRHEDINFIWLILLGELTIVLGSTATDFIRRWLLLHMLMRINISLVSDFFIKLFKLPMAFFETKLLGDILQRMGDHGRIQSFLTTQMLGIIFTMLSFLVFGAVLFIYNRLIFCIFCAGSLMYGIWIAAFLSKRKILDFELFDRQSTNQNLTYQMITSMQEIKLHNCEQRRRWEWEDSQADLFNVQMKSMKLQQTQEAGSVFINEIKNILITIFTATAVINHELTLGAMLAIQYIVGQLNSPVEQLMAFIYSLQDVKISLERINEIHKRSDEDGDSRCITSIPDDKSICLCNVDFKYNPHSLRKTISDVTFDIPEGKVTAIVGASGSGKTTLIKLLLGYFPVMEGKITIGGINLNDYNLKCWRGRCGAVMQEGVIFSESIARNIAVDDNEIDIAKLEKAARIANIHDYVISLPLKYNTKIGRDGMGLSQGQKQRILIARAIYKSPQYIFLDEATNALDAKNERDIVENLTEFYKGRTVVVVAHRLSTVKYADNIIVMENGEIAEMGTHDDLIKCKGVYFNLVKNQLELGS